MKCFVSTHLELFKSPQTTWLPKLPVPPLEQTMAGYLDAVEVAVQDENQKAETRKRVEQFMKQPDGIAFKLQDLLLEKQSKEENWVLPSMSNFNFIAH